MFHLISVSRRALIAGCALLFVLAACRSQEPLTAAEQRAVHRLVRDPRASILRVYRESDGTLQAVTRQGEEEIAYRIHFAEDGAAIYQRLPIYHFGPRENR